MSRRRWGKAGVPLTAAESAAIQGRRYRRELDEQRAYREWQAGKVVPYRITIALDFHGLQGPDVDEACGVHEPQVDRWEAGTLYPTWEQLQALAELTGNTPGFFTRQPHQDLPLETSLRFHRVGGQRCDTRQPPPVRTFLPEAITATVEEAEHAHPLPAMRPGHPPRRPRPDDAPASPQVRASARRHDHRSRGERVPRLRNAEAVDVMTLDRTGEPIDDTVGHRPGIDCLPGGWKLGHGPDDETMAGCPFCRPWLRNEERDAKKWGNNPEARPRAAVDPSSVATRPSEIGAEQK